MSSNSTVGIYNGQPADPDAEARKMFTEWENQQDGLAAILTYCQNKVGFHVGSTDTGPLRQVLADEFSGIIRFQELLASNGFEKSYPVGTMPSAEELKPYFPVDYVYKLFVAKATMNVSYTSVIQLIVRAEDDLTLDIPETHIFRSDLIETVRTLRNFGFINRSEMARRADELMDKLKLRESIGEWAKKITSDGWQP